MAFDINKAFKASNPGFDKWQQMLGPWRGVASARGNSVDMSNLFKQMFQFAQSGYGDADKFLTGYGDQAKADTRRAGIGERNQQSSFLASRGMGNTTALDSLHGRSRYNEQRNVNQIGENVASRQSGLRERGTNFMSGILGQNANSQQNIQQMMWNLMANQWSGEEKNKANSGFAQWAPLIGGMLGGGGLGDLMGMFGGGAGPGPGSGWQGNPTAPNNFVQQ